MKIIVPMAIDPLFAVVITIRPMVGTPRGPVANSTTPLVIDRLSVADYKITPPAGAPL